MRIAIVNDLPIAVAALRKVVQTVPDYQVIWTAKNGAEAVDRCAQDTPDLILMDLLMPVMDGVESTRQIMKKSPCGILVVTSNTEKHVDRVYEAMCHGALDAVDTPILDASDNARSASTLLAKIATIRKLLKPAALSQKSKTSVSPSKSTLKPSTFERSSLWSTAPPIIAIGSSTGGPKALATVLSKLPVGFNAAIAVVQHVDAQFSAGLVSWLNQQVALPVRVARAGDALEPGTILVAGTNDHLYVRSDLTLGYTTDPIDYPYRPSVDVFFKSLAEHWTRRGTAVLLTGMGRDGAEGLSALRARGWHTIAQDKESCVVYGMPRAAVELNAAVEVLSPDAIATVLVQALKSKR
ncbi:chemotaxis response regulator protein-glutamate methylesterase [Leptothermofonsia sichuanensis E412]|uniref:chemotaxis response regulator protein-glutamate methylesterase n=1 Tax=Leptothermofonsia sichuanensis TaxID=2917832 RepID=UPI001CA6F213|nr:chemotaxis response regulator protein-glutamate methylesterase [Leptothermofonsia sichuanensis]QZZ21493.1 chemotaxis response regulator protein-glutamate methylesterase [Leptothermofonsia sichuanensis E412]